MVFYLVAKPHLSLFEESENVMNNLALWIRDQIRVVLNSMLYTKTHWKIVFLYVWLLYMQGRRRNDCNVLSNFLD